MEQKEYEPATGEEVTVKRKGMAILIIAFFSYGFL